MGLALVLLFWFLGVGIPLLAMVVRALGDHGFWVTLVDPAVLSVVGVTALQAALSTVLSLLLGVPFGLALGTLSRRLSVRLTESLLALPFGVPTLVVGVAWIAWLGRSGILRMWGLEWDLAYSFSAVILAHVFLNVPWVALLTAQARGRVSPRQVEAARTLGGSFFQELRWVLWPDMWRSVASAAAQVFSLCVMSFALILILGGGPPVQTLETEVYMRFRLGALTAGGVGGLLACAFWQLLLSLPPWMLVLRLGRTPHAVLLGRSEREGGVPARRLRWSGVWAKLLSVGAFFFLMPYCVLWLQVSPSSVAWAEIQRPLLISLQIAVATSVGAIFIAFVAARVVVQLKVWGERLGVLLAIPSGISILVLGLGFWLAYGRWLDPFEGSLFAIVVLQMVLFFPTAYRMFWPLAVVPPNHLMGAARATGATEWQVFRFVEWPRWRKVVFAALAMVAGASLGEVAAVSLFFSEKLLPLPLLLSQWMGQYRFESARTLSGLLLFLSLGVMGGVMGAVGAGNKAEEQRRA